jgi:hypothetical protein
MKRLSVILLLAVQIGLLFNKSFTVLHFLFHRAEIIEHFCHHATQEEEENCQGICYLKAEFEHHDKNNPQTFPIQSLVQQEVVFIEPLPYFSLKTISFDDKVTQNFIVKTPVYYETHLSVWRPPTAA